MGEPLGGDAWAIRVHYKPFVRWVWLGAAGATLLLPVVRIFWPQAAPETTAAVVPLALDPIVVTVASGSVL